MHEMTVTCVQVPHTPAESSAAATVAATLAAQRRALETVLPDRPDLIVLQESSDIPRPATTEQVLAHIRERGERSAAQLAGIARDAGAVIAYTSLAEHDGRLRNRMRLIAGDGELLHYDKVHVPPTPELRMGVVPGSGPCVADTRLGRLGALICFDIMFLESIAEHADLHPQLLLFASLMHGGFWQPTWALGSRSWIAAAIDAPHSCAILNPVGMTVAASTTWTPWATARIDLDYAVAHHDDNEPAFRRARAALGPTLVLTDPGQTGAVLVTTRDPGLSAAQVCRDFGIEQWDAFITRSRAERRAALEGKGAYRS